MQIANTNATCANITTLQNKQGWQASWGTHEIETRTVVDSPAEIGRAFKEDHWKDDSKVKRK